MWFERYQEIVATDFKKLMRHSDHGRRANSHMCCCAHVFTGIRMHEAPWPRCNLREWRDMVRGLRILA